MTEKKITNKWKTESTYAGSNICGLCDSKEVIEHLTSYMRFTLCKTCYADTKKIELASFMTLSNKGCFTVTTSWNGKEFKIKRSNGEIALAKPAHYMNDNYANVLLKGSELFLSIEYKSDMGRKAVPIKDICGLNPDLEPFKMNLPKSISYSELMEIFPENNEREKDNKANFVKLKDFLTMSS